MVSGMNWFPNRDAVLFMVEDIWPLLAQAVPDVKLDHRRRQPARSRCSTSRRVTHVSP